MEEYRVNETVEYETDDDYRKCLLAVFGLQEYDGEIHNGLVEKIDSLSKEIKDTKLLERAAELGTGFEPDLAFFMLFSYDEFKTTHAAITALRLDIETDKARVQIDVEPNNTTTVFGVDTNVKDFV